MSMTRRDATRDGKRNARSDESRPREYQITRDEGHTHMLLPRKESISEPESVGLRQEPPVRRSAGRRLPASPPPSARVPDEQVVDRVDHRLLSPPPGRTARKSAAAACSTTSEDEAGRNMATMDAAAMMATMMYGTRNALRRHRSGPERAGGSRWPGRGRSSGRRRRPDEPEPAALRV